VLPYDESSGLIAELVGNLASLLMQLNLWRRAGAGAAAGGVAAGLSRSAE
jgi:exonuclease V gamma subunit